MKLFSPIISKQNACQPRAPGEFLGAALLQREPKPADKIRKFTITKKFFSAPRTFAFTFTSAAMASGCAEGSGSGRGDLFNWVAGTLFITLAVLGSLFINSVAQWKKERRNSAKNKTTLPVPPLRTTFERVYPAGYIMGETPVPADASPVGWTGIGAPAQGGTHVTWDFGTGKSSKVSLTSAQNRRSVFEVVDPSKLRSTALPYSGKAFYMPKDDGILVDGNGHDGHGHTRQLKQGFSSLLGAQGAIAVAARVDETHNKLWTLRFHGAKTDSDTVVQKYQVLIERLQTEGMVLKSASAAGDMLNTMQSAIRTLIKIEHFIEWAGANDASLILLTNLSSHANALHEYLESNGMEVINAHLKVDGRHYAYNGAAVRTTKIA